MSVTSAQLAERTAAAADIAASEAGEIDYPDRQSVGQGLRHNAAMRFAIGALEEYFLARKDVLVASEFVMYYQRGDNRSWLQPDVLVAFGVPSASERSVSEGSVYKTWEEGKVPDFVLEVASPSKARRDAGFKALKYAALGVREYWRLDPDPAGRLMERDLEGCRWQQGSYEPVAAVERNGGEALRSEVLGLDLRVATQGRGTFMVFRDPRTGEEFDGRPETALQQRRLAEEELIAARDQVRELKRQIREIKGQDS